MDPVRRVLVTGASRGIGRAIASRLAADGFVITVHYRRHVAGAKEAAAAIRSAGGVATTLAFDVGERAAAREALEADVERNGAYWGIVVNAGVTADGTFAAMPPEEWDAVLTTNLGGFYNVVQPLVMPMVRQRRGGRIVTISSVSGVIGNRGQVNYSAAKAGIIGATKALALELGSRDITVNCVAPGLIETGMSAGAAYQEILRQIPVRRVGTPEEVAATVSFLFSDGASYITRQVIGVNGGLI